VTLAIGSGDGSVRVVAQFLEGGAASAAISPDSAVACLRRAGDVLPLTDICLGWNLPQPLIEAVAGEAEARGYTLWLWQPLLSGDGQHVPAEDAALGRDGSLLPWPRGMAEFAFDCPNRAQGLDRALRRLEVAIDRGAWDGVFLDKIRWPSPTRDPTDDLACFCDDCSSMSAEAGVDLEAVARYVEHAAATPVGRVDLLAELLGRTDGPMAPFMTWRCGRITHAVREAAARVTSRVTPRGESLRLALDVFAPSLARAVGQDIPSLAPLATFTKAMLYIGTNGPAGLPYELCGLWRWLARGGVREPAARLAEMLGYPLPEVELARGGALGTAVFAAELTALRRLAGQGAAAGIDAIELPGMATLDDEALAEVAHIAGTLGTTLVLAWDLWSMPPARLAIVARALGMSAPRGAAAC
jgi:hypothetical protein